MLGTFRRRVWTDQDERDRARRGPTASVTRRSRRMGRIGQLESPLGCRVREAVMRVTPDRVAAHQLATDFKYEVAPLLA